MRLPRLIIVTIGVIIILTFTVVTFSPRVADALENEKKQVTITAILDDQGDPPRLLNMLPTCNQRVRG